ncbi:uncharacterized protein LOC122268139 [Penaeus japonicus]|uniref:uncharacterized protein LOC122268139 n=1 Tax=Penaeus japonicus TaxID=27405 RepID=UPI001C71615A|nr:uncharacterized protein LOC122268139 [Penaeus japonicus]
MVGLRIRRKFPLLLGCLALLFLTLKRGKQLRTYELFIPNQEPKAVWDFVADFSNMPKLNTKIRLRQMTELGTLTRPELRALDAPRGDLRDHGRRLPLRHQREPRRGAGGARQAPRPFLPAGVKNHGKMDFRRDARHGVRGTLFQQEAFSDCPLLLAPLCSYEIDHNRHAFLANLASAFAK